MNISKLNRIIFQQFRSNGLSLNGDANNALLRLLNLNRNDEDRTPSDIEIECKDLLMKILDEIKSRIDKGEVKSSVINANVIETVVADLSSSEDDIKEESIQLFNAFNSPKLVFEERLKTYRLDLNPKYRLLGDTSSRANMYRERLLLTQQRLLRSGFFVLRGISSRIVGNAILEQHELSTIESLLGSSGSRILFGMLTQPEDGIWYLEDLSSVIKLHFANANISTGLLTENSQIIVKGELHNGIFVIDNIGFPPAEERKKTLDSCGLPDTFGMRSQQLQQLAELELQDDDMMMVVISDIQLDKPNVYEKLQVLFQGYENAEVYPLFILMGSFTSKSATVTGGHDAAKGAFDRLADVISSCRNISELAKFIIIPGNRDPGINKILPRRPIPDLFVESLKKKVKHITFASNPCRIRLYTQEIVFFREDLLQKMQRFTASPPKDEVDVTQQIVVSLIEQAHLWPLPIEAKPIFWELDYTMRLTPLPHLIVLGDHVDQYSYEISGCKAVNTGSFTSDNSFIVYRPSSTDIEFSRVPDE